MNMSQTHCSGKIVIHICAAPTSTLNAYQIHQIRTILITVNILNGYTQDIKFKSKNIHHSKLNLDTIPITTPTNGFHSIDRLRNS